MRPLRILLIVAVVAQVALCVMTLERRAPSPARLQLNPPVSLVSGRNTVMADATTPSHVQRGIYALLEARGALAVSAEVRARLETLRPGDELQVLEVLSPPQRRVLAGGCAAR